MEQSQALLTLFVLSAALLAWGTVSAVLERRSVTAPIVFVVAGVVLASEPLHVVHLAVADLPVREVAEVTLALVLFSDASRVRVSELTRHANLPSRLLLVGLPLTVVASTVLAVLLFPGLDPWAAAVVAAACAPTDAALGSAVVDDERVPERLRNTLSVESGLNDGMVTPVVMFCLAGASATAGSSSSGWEGSALLELVLGVVVGAGLGALSGRVLTGARRAGWAAPAYAQLAALGASLACYSGARLVGGNGFVAAFVGGLAFGSLVRRGGGAPHLELDTSLGSLLSLVVWFVFGTALVVALASVTIAALVYAVLALTVLRMVPVAVALAGARLDRRTVLFIGWFGPRGLASVVFLLLAYAALDGSARDTVVSVVALTVALSVLAHGMTARPGIRRYLGLTRSPAPPRS